MTRTRRSAHGAKSKRAATGPSRIVVAPSLALPCYSRAFVLMLERLAYHFAAEQNQLVRSIGFSQKVPALYPQLIKGDKSTVKLESFPLSAELRFTNDEILNGRRDQFLTKVAELGQKFAAGLVKQFIAMMNKVTKATGLELDGREYPNRVERFFAMLEKIEMIFDENGNAVKPSIMAAPKEAKALFDELEATGSEGKKRLEDIIAKKREKWIATKSNRCLPQLFKD